MIIFLCNYIRMKGCATNQRRHLTTTIDKALYDRLIPIIKKDWGGPFSSWLDYVATCWLRESCSGCVYAEQEGQEKASLGKIATEEDNSE